MSHYNNIQLPNIDQLISNNSNITESTLPIPPCQFVGCNLLQESRLGYCPLHLSTNEKEILMNRLRDLLLLVTQIRNSL